eukprot:ANDGO_07982.mRNA.1 mitochondrial RNA-editing ligase 2
MECKTQRVERTIDQSMDNAAYRSYDKIPESLDEALKCFSTDAVRKLKHLEFAVLEKVHGANLCFIVRNGEDLIVSAKRRGVIGRDERFFDHWIIEEKHRHSILLFARAAERMVCDLQQKGMLCRGLRMSQISLFGEIFGGWFPEGEPQKRVDPPRTCKCVQKGVYYSSTIEWTCFDVRMDFEDGQSRWMDWDAAMSCAKLAHLPLLEPLFRGTLNNCMHFSNRFQTTLPRLFNINSNLPWNLAEGVIIKPVTGWMLDGPLSLLPRPIVKRKIDEFAEDGRYHAADGELWEASAPHLAVPEWASILTVLVNKNRIESAESKIGALSNGNLEELADVVVDDVLSAVYNVQETAEWASRLQPTEWEQVPRILRSLVIQVCTNRINSSLPSGNKS